ncbi:hypothetical protein OG352_05460 [Streptomyces sp. NBC_01485]|uniref:hypothetical protein n=1 Tax=Streptomyces sp. NBC_01485 TaxID=2903884 RepID=UPI002E369FFC|nr:hypothetical protein [Streptomyces sp. NBC_01485]
MTTLAPERAPATVGDADDDLTHSVCECTPDIALCGTDMAGAEWADEDDDVTCCVVCLDLEDEPCPKCGQ